MRRPSKETAGSAEAAKSGTRGRSRFSSRSIRVVRPERKRSAPCIQASGSYELAAVYRIGGRSSAIALGTGFAGRNAIASRAQANIDRDSTNPLLLSPGVADATVDPPARARGKV